MYSNKKSRCQVFACERASVAFDIIKLQWGKVFNIIIGHHVFIILLEIISWFVSVVSPKKMIETLDMIAASYFSVPVSQ